MENKLGMIVILNCERRKQEGQYMYKLLEMNAKALGIPVVISFDDGSLHIWGNFRQALQIGENKGTHRMIIHDDVSIDRLAIEKAIHILNYLPADSYLSIYNPDNSDYRKARAEKKRILQTKTNFWLQACIYPDNLCADFLNWVDANVAPEYPYEDGRLSPFIDTQEKTMFAVVPGLVQHFGAYRSTFKQGGVVAGHKRYSATVNGSQNVKDVDWESEFKNPFMAKMKTDNYLTKLQKKNLEAGLC